MIHRLGHRTFETESGEANARNRRNVAGAVPTELASSCRERHLVFLRELRHGRLGFGVRSIPLGVAH